MMREIVLDTETTGLDPKKGDRLIEIGCIEIFNRIPTGREFHRFINPERDVPAEAQKHSRHFDRVPCRQTAVSRCRARFSGVHRR